MGIFDRLIDYLNDVKQTLEIEDMKSKSDKQLKEIVRSGGSSARAMGKKKAALAELKRRGYDV